MNKKSISVLLTAAMAASMLTVPAFAEDATEAPAEGDTVVLQAEDPSKATAYDFDLTVLGDTPATKLDDAVKTDGDFVIGFSDSFSGNSWRQQMEKEFKTAAEKYKEAGYISDYVMLDAGGDQTKQISDIEDLITQGVNAIVVDAITNTALNDVLQEAMDEGILVFNCDNIVSIDVTSKVGGNDYKAGYEGGKWMGTQLEGKGGKIVILDGQAGSDVDTNRHNGMTDGLKETDPDAEIVATENADWDYATASTAMGTILSANPEIDGVLSQGGAMTMAAIDAFQAAGRDLVPMTGEANNGFLRLWSENKDKGFSSTAFSNPCMVSVMCLNLAVNALNGVEVAPNYEVDMPMVTDDNVGQLYDADLSDSFWIYSILSEDEVKELFAE